MRLRLILIVLVIISSTIAAQEQFIVKPPTTDSLAILKVGVQLPFQVQTSIGYNFTPKFRAGVQYGWVRNSLYNAGFNLINPVSELVQGKVLLDSVNWKGNSFGINFSRTFRNFYIRASLENANFIRNKLYVSKMPSTEAMFNSAFPNDTLTSQSFLGFNSSQTFLDVSVGTSLLNISKKIYLVGEVSFRRIINSRYFFLLNPSGYDSLSDELKNYYLALEEDIKSTMNLAAFRPSVNLYLVYKLRTCDCENF